MEAELREKERLESFSAEPRRSPRQDAYEVAEEAKETLELGAPAAAAAAAEPRRSPRQDASEVAEEAKETSELAAPAAAVAAAAAPATQSAAKPLPLVGDKTVNNQNKQSVEQHQILDMKLNK